MHAQWAIILDDEFLEGKQPESVAAVLKVFAILQALAQRSETGVSDLSIKLAMPKATVYRFLQTMKTLGFVMRTFPDAVTGEMLAFSYWFAEPYLAYHVIDATGKLVRTAP